MSLILIKEGHYDPPFVFKGILKSSALSQLHGNNKEHSC